MSVVDEFIEWAAASLPESDEAVAYFRGRGVSSDQFLRHRLGYVLGDFEADPGRDPAHSAACRDKESRQKWCDSCRLNRWSTKWVEVEGDTRKEPIVGRRIVGCVVLPLTTYSGAYAGFQIRSVLEKEYDTFLVSRRPEGFFFGLAPNVQSIWSSRSIFLAEGPFDQLVFERLVSRNIVAMTTNTLAGRQEAFIQRFVDRAFPLLDRDAGGRDGAAAIEEKIGSSVSVRPFRVPKARPRDKDMNDYWKAVGDDAFAAYFRKNVLSLI